MSPVPLPTRDAPPFGPGLAPRHGRLGHVRGGRLPWQGWRDGAEGVTEGCIHRANGMPVGATLIGRAGTDTQLLGYACAFEQATQLRVEPRIDGRRVG